MAIRRRSQRLKLLAVVSLLLVVTIPLVLIARCGKPRETARRELEARAIPYTEQEFVNRVRRSDVEVVKLFLSAGINPNVRSPQGSTVLMDSVTMNDTPVLEMLIRSGADVNAGNNEGETPLMIAALKGNPDSVKLLLDAGANLNARDQRGETPLRHALERNHSEVIQMLMNAGAK
jgi:predicted component of type VI protein secretion system